MRTDTPHRRLLAALGGCTAVARDTGVPIGTVLYWSSRGRISADRLPLVRALAEDRGIDPDEAMKGRPSAMEQT